MSTEQYGRKRRVVGAHYGTLDFLAQRITAVILASYSIIFLVALLVTPIDFMSWKRFFTFTCFSLPLGRIFVTLSFVALAWHAWVGVRDIWMDYVKPFGIRLALFAFTILWLVGCIAYFAAIVWSL